MSRFVDSADDYEQPHHVSRGDVQIDAKHLPELKHEIFGIGADRHAAKFADKLENAIEFNGNDLFNKFKPMFQDRNKAFLYKTIMDKHNYVPSRDRRVLMTRWLTFTLPDSTSTFKTKVTYKSDTFTYDQNQDKSTIEWHLNFANYDLFSYYSQRLLAQDELQVLECFQLASIREYLCGCNYSFSSKVGENGEKPTPILISNVERVLNIDTTNIYGNKFTKATQQEIIDASTYLNPASIVNILAIEAPKSGQGSYKESEIRYILLTCYTGFMAAKLLASKTNQLNEMQQKITSSSLSLKTIIHTGWFGCGAYGGNRILMLILQIIAAKLAEIHEIVFHTLAIDCEAEINEASVCLGEIEKSGRMDIDGLINHLVKKNYKWDISNGT
ncbi:unnamed protein product [Didymodactylos carnosus]|uniref:PARG catalytic Macro domain-containing protein n=1 Tax=Didymodactylos carnosus TaxID=1234261 RepID=A0A814GSB1_9BILA|nr:unnamed protein product [Didymodactylos carnosus]CAF1000056.1 unnamed protein product [Didymodactylos carnosus]CAF3740838.1 unnamed protein product [Didymodactylos carnosus]CAF3771534.1 unnamed protein product [Didymodactylos carnosus]